MTDIYSATEAGARLGIHPSLVRVYIRQGRIKARRTSLGYLIEDRELARFERSRPKRGRPRRQEAAAR